MKSRIAKDAVLAEFEGEDSILLDIEARRYHRLNETAALIWKAVERKASNEEIVTDLMNAFEVDQESAKAAVEGFLSDLAARGLVQDDSEISPS